MRFILFVVPEDSAP